MNNLDLIDWRLVGFSALWIAGLSIELAALSFADYIAAQRGVRIRTVLGQPGYQTAINGGLMLFCLGLLGSARVWWEQLLWLVLAAAFAYQTWVAWRKQIPSSTDTPPKPQGAGETDSTDKNP